MAFFWLSFGLFLGVLLIFFGTRFRWRRDIEPMRNTSSTKPQLQVSSDGPPQPSPSKVKLDTIITEKKNRFLNIPNIAFHFVDERQIRSFYDDYFREPTIASLVSEISGEVDGELKGSLPQFLESRIGSKDLTKWVSTIKLPDTSLSGMFLRYQRETIKNGQVMLGLEEVDIELTELQAFDEVVEILRKRFDLRLDEDLVLSQRRHLREKAAERTLAKLEQATGWILIEGRFTIEKEGDFYRCVLVHPVNEYLTNATGQVTIVVRVPATGLQERIVPNYEGSVGRRVPLRIYAQVWQPVDRGSNTLELQLTPLAIY